MKAVVVGCGKVGTELAKTLVNDGHDVSVVDVDPKALEEVRSNLDVMTYLGSGADISVLEQAGIREANMFIAISASDELNLLTCLMAKQECKGELETVARVRDPFYSHETNFFRKQLGISRIINPEKLAAEEIFNLLQFPTLSRIDDLEGTDVVISKLHVKKEYKLCGKTLIEIRKAAPDVKAIVCAVYRNEESSIPKGNFRIEAGDDITIVAKRDELKRLLRAHGINLSHTESIIITGGGTIAYYLAQKLLEQGKHLRIIDNNEKRCAALSEALPDADILYGDGTDRKFLLKHGLKAADAFVPLTGIDEENIIIAAFAKNYSDLKVITKVTRTDMNDLIKSLNLDSVIFPKLICADIIAQHVRARDAGYGGNVAKIFRYLDDSIDIVELRATGGDSSVLNIPLKELNLIPELIIAGINHDGEFEVPNGNSVIRMDDHVLIVTKHKGITFLHNILD